MAVTVYTKSFKEFKNSVDMVNTYLTSTPGKVKGIAPSRKKILDKNMNPGEKVIAHLFINLKLTRLKATLLKEAKTAFEALLKMIPDELTQGNLASSERLEIDDDKDNTLAKEIRVWAEVLHKLCIDIDKLINSAREGKYGKRVGLSQNSKGDADLTIKSQRAASYSIAKQLSAGMKDGSFLSELRNQATAIIKSLGHRLQVLFKDINTIQEQINDAFSDDNEAHSDQNKSRIPYNQLEPESERIITKLREFTHNVTHRNAELIRQRKNDRKRSNAKNRYRKFSETSDNGTDHTNPSTPKPGRKKTIKRTSPEKGVHF